jgi:hypothetical protein
LGGGWQTHQSLCDVNLMKNKQKFKENVKIHAEFEHFHRLINEKKGLDARN